MFFTVITKNLNWKILTKNLVTFKRWFFFVHKKKKERVVFLRGMRYGLLRHYGVLINSRGGENVTIKLANRHTYWAPV